METNAAKAEKALQEMTTRVAEEKEQREAAERESRAQAAERSLMSRYGLSACMT